LYLVVTISLLKIITEDEENQSYNERYTYTLRELSLRYLNPHPNGVGMGLEWGWNGVGMGLEWGWNGVGIVFKKSLSPINLI